MTEKINDNNEFEMGMAEFAGERYNETAELVQERSMAGKHQQAYR